MLAILPVSHINFDITSCVVWQNHILEFGFVSAEAGLKTDVYDRVSFDQLFNDIPVQRQEHTDTQNEMLEKFENLKKLNYGR